jgi:hypothetical protein
VHIQVWPPAFKEDFALLAGMPTKRAKWSFNAQAAQTEFEVAS